MDGAKKPDPQPDDGSVLSEWLTAAELAAELNVSKDTLQRWQNARIGPPRIKVGGKALYRRDSVREWLRQKEADEA